MIRPEVLIRVAHATLYYKLKPALRDINLEIRKGEVVSLMGPNGCGKSTLMGLLAGLLSPLKGCVEIDGKRRRSTPEAELAIRKQVVYLPAEPWMPLGCTGRDWLWAAGRLYDIPEDRLSDHAERLLDIFDMAKKGDEGISGFSTGEKKKIALCGALVTEAPVMLLDEPFAGGLDPSGTVALKALLQRYAERDDYTIVFATPVPQLVEELADRIAVIGNGQIVACDTLAGLRKKSGCPGSLEEVYERIVNPGTHERIEKYFEGRAL